MAQSEYWKNKLSNDPKFIYLGVYADEGITGTSVKNRKQFNKMIEDCRAGKIDQIYVKSISRFARNTVDCVSYIRELKGLGENIHFENIFTSLTERLQIDKAKNLLINLKCGLTLTEYIR